MSRSASRTIRHHGLNGSIAQRFPSFFISLLVQAVTGVADALVANVLGQGLMIESGGAYKRRYSNGTSSVLNYILEVTV